ncbi:ABC-type transporter Mla maintaining outer membrane lipid asymmetry, component MlaD [Fodinibius roseus]|uniref:ABC-type transporter Mla maintaining outer membrane lipid asymmetry, component MlaD n=1 Tax=Fodinibius roseus TaxID=1194090 RepID=A0A1M5IGG2_9BACT|nr:MlaD family protein [Fodinibius roseus]SHG27347.1 ABC-type transporter Mla maintaining outer membrane lipid asymmetry, component MlaD [Fodinibius roseus]
MKISNELKVALTILVALVAGFFGYRLMGDMPMFRQSKIIHAHFVQADGLTPGSYIFVSGVRVGSVKSMQLSNGDSVKVSMSLDLDTHIPKDSEAHLQSSGLLDEKAIVIIRGNSQQDVEHNDEIKGIYEGGMMETLKQEGEQLSEDVSESFEKLNTLLEELNTMVDEEAQGKIDTTLTNLQTSTDEMATLFRNKRSDLELSITHAQQFLANMDTVSTRNKSRIDSVLTGLDRSLTELEVLSHELTQTNRELREVLVKINNGEGSLGKLVNDPGLYDNLESLSGEMDLLIKNINEDPGKYLKHMRLIEVF